MAETIAPSQTSPQSNRPRESASPRSPETDLQPVTPPFAQQIPGIVRRAKMDIRSLAPAEILTLQRTIGNQALLRLIAGAQPLQTKLTLGASDDVYEKGADSVADQVMSNSSTLPRQGAAAGAAGSEEDSERPCTPRGHQLLAHELTHTIQQTGGRPLGSHLARLAQAKSGLVQRDADTPTNQTPAAAPANQTPDDSGPVSLPPITGVGEPEDFYLEGGCDGLRLHGVTDGTFDGGRFNLVNEVVAKSDSCNCAKGVQCLHVTGTLVTDYSVSVTIAMPSAPGGLTDCEQAKVQDFLQNVLMPHERDHQTRLMTYNGQTQNPIDITGCGRDEILNKVKAIQGAENAARKAAARALSAAIDPFQRSVDCSDCQKDAGAPDAGSGASPDARAPSAGATRPDAGG
jgi:Domain of unknown function (DUF4157)